MNDFNTFFNDKPDLLFIFNKIEPNSSVLDLGCGGGDLLYFLKHKKNCRIQGIDISFEQINLCIEKGVDVIQDDLNKGLSYYPDDSFDYVILGQTFQQVKNPEVIVKDMIRVGKNAIVSVVNLAYIYTRLSLSIKGVMPRSKTLPYQWYNTPNIHLGSHLDFINMCQEQDIPIINTKAFGKNNFLAKIWPNFLAEFCVYTLK